MRFIIFILLLTLVWACEVNNSTSEKLAENDSMVINDFPIDSIGTAHNRTVECFMSKIVNHPNKEIDTSLLFTFYFDCANETAAHLGIMPFDSSYRDLLSKLHGEIIEAMSNTSMNDPYDFPIPYKSEHLSRYPKEDSILLERIKMEINSIEDRTLSIEKAEQYRDSIKGGLIKLSSEAEEFALATLIFVIDDVKFWEEMSQRKGFNDSLRQKKIQF